MTYELKVSLVPARHPDLGVPLALHRLLHPNQEGLQHVPLSETPPLLLRYLVPLQSHPLVKVTSWDQVLVQPALRKERGLQSLQVARKRHLRVGAGIRPVKHEPDHHQLLVEVLSRPHDLDFGALLHLDLVHVQNLSDELVGHLPRGTAAQEISHIAVDVAQDSRLQGRLTLLEGLLLIDLALLSLVLHCVLDQEIAHLAFYLLLLIEGLPELVVAVLKVAPLALLFLHLLVPLPLLASQNGLYLLSHHHKWFECALQTGRHLLKESVGRKQVWLLGSLGLEQLLPGFVGSHEEPQSDCFEGVLWRLGDWLLGVVPEFDGFLLHADSKLGEERGTEGGGLGLGESLAIDRGMVLQPEFHQMQKDLVVVDDGPVEVPGLVLPLVAQLAADFLEEDGELVELVLGLLLAEEVEAGVVVDVVLLGIVAEGGLDAGHALEPGSLLLLHLQSILYDARPYFSYASVTSTLKTTKITSSNELGLVIPMAGKTC